MTLHATHHVDVLSNVCVDHVGHGFFLEDGGEKYNLIKGNLGMGTKVSIIIVDAIMCVRSV